MYEIQNFVSPMMLSSLQSQIFTG